ncbi:chemotaxis protein CheD [Aureimonas pseudogalii]|uniref:Probable chemoreceptor glutamine deamidase CheD n=1 Tax=Aureimonas pseudogalii TaxID=1744844 RepID=A0A7W6H6R8_9HYPH|nr:chemotaxis protein CheD [Aureimonas pseudogalii]MBB3999639.1 chemotaxis protein CheD [Aureimonas pseudogalii]
MSTVQAETRVHVGEGETRIESDAHLVLTTVLGSCVAACIFDRTARTGGMNHFLLSGEGGTGAGAAERYGAFLMEVLVNGLLARGAKRGRLEAKLFGGSRIGATRGDIGEANATFAKGFLAMENIPLLGGSLGGTSARRVEFWPTSGRARQIALANEPPPPAPPPRPALADLGEVEFF